MASINTEVPKEIIDFLAEKISNIPESKQNDVMTDILKYVTSKPENIKPKKKLDITEILNQIQMVPPVDCEDKQQFYTDQYIKYLMLKDGKTESDFDTEDILKQYYSPKHDKLRDNITDALIMMIIMYDDEQLMCPGINKALELLKKDAMETDLMSNEVGPIRINGLYDNKGFVELIDMMPRIVPKGRFADRAVVSSARISYGGTIETIAKDNNLIRFLWTNKHVTPFESVVFTIRVRVPIFIARQIMRHRLFSYNEISYRYTEPKEEFFYPKVRFQDDVNRQMSKSVEDMTDEEKEKVDYINTEWDGYCNDATELCWNAYKHMIKDNNVSREVARTILPVGLMTEMIMTGNVRTWLHFLQLRLENDAQKEIRDLSEALVKVIQPRIPVTYETFLDCDVNNSNIPKSWIDCISSFNSYRDTCADWTWTNFKATWKEYGIVGARKHKEFVKLLTNLGIINEASAGDDTIKMLVE